MLKQTAVDQAMIVGLNNPEGKASKGTVAKEQSLLADPRQSSLHDPEVASAIHAIIRDLDLVIAHRANAMPGHVLMNDAMIAIIIVPVVILMTMMKTPDLDGDEVPPLVLNKIVAILPPDVILTIIMRHHVTPMIEDALDLGVTTIIMITLEIMMLVRHRGRDHGAALDHLKTVPVLETGRGPRPSLGPTRVTLHGMQW